ncbi:hypothetical protein TNCV_3666051 [Trichonephila clavipes]|uniref:Uncharacterized protein n=1 Tax=Trichonephila clavipes TaxID=2585209 RepID=A0A8X6V8W9_TRICX|nr:hypothetical protein TNCV_3666051 [Trichonephila clavipes]
MYRNALPIPIARKTRYIVELISFKPHLDVAKIAKCWAAENVDSFHVLPKIAELAEGGLCNMNYVRLIQKTVMSNGQTKLGNCFTHWPHGKIFKIVPPDLIGIPLSVWP